MNFIGTKELNSERLTLRKRQENDYIAMFNNYANKEEVTKYLTWHPYEKIEDAHEFVKKYCLNYDNSTFKWVITLSNNTQEIIGSIDVISLNKEKEEVEIGYVLSPLFWNKGIMSETLKMVTSYLFNEVNLKRILIRFDIRNIASYKVMKKNGYKDLKVEETINKNEKCIVKYTYLDKSDYILMNL